MADEIINGRVHKKAGDNSVIKYEFTYYVEDGGEHTFLPIEVTAGEMTDPTDAAEAKTLANAKATTDKATWITAKFDKAVITEENSQNGPVTL